MEKTNNFTEGPITLPLIKFALPVLGALLLQSLYGGVDMWVVGNFGTTADVSAVNTGSWLMMTITQVIIGLSMGTTILLGQMIGMKREDELGDVMGTGICLFAILGIIVTVIIEIMANPIATIMQSPEEAFAGTVLYLRICGAGLLFIVAYNLLGALFRGLGNSRVPLMTVAIACVINIAGDLFLVGGLKMGVAGAAIATVMAQAFSVIISLFIIGKRGLSFEFGIKNIRIIRPHLKATVKLGLPIAFQDTLISISFLVVTAIVNSLGVTASAGIGVAEKLCGFIMLVPSAIMQSMAAFVAQNIGAGKWNRALNTLRSGLIISVAAGIVMAYFTYFHGTFMASLFAAGKDDVIACAYEYLKAYAFDTLLVSGMFCFVGFFNGCGRTRFVMLQGITGAFLVRIPFSFIMKMREPVSLFWIGMATPASSLLQLTLCLLYFAYVSGKMKKDPTFIHT
ncbi:MAG: MATE family efflux transporter [Eubacterium sp.]|nr:MATE family efflux transporter [Eubacterium sp.]